jgi:single-strand DNA-binding protein
VSRDQLPATSNQKQETSDQQPATSNQKPATSNQQPVDIPTCLLYQVLNENSLQSKEGIMSGINKVILIGRLGSDPEVRYTPSGVAVANFSVATSEEWKDKNTGEKQERTEWHRIVAWRRLGEICGEYLSKGKQIYVEGRIQTRSWDDRDGNKKYTTEIIASDIQFLGSRDMSDSGRPQGDRPQGGMAGGSQGAPGPGPEDDDIPF